MHLRTKDEKTGEVNGVLCVDRDTRTGIVLRADASCLNNLAQLAFDLKAPEVLIYVDETEVDDLVSLGWARAEGMVVMARKAGGNNGKGT